MMLPTTPLEDALYDTLLLVRAYLTTDTLDDDARLRLVFLIGDAVKLYDEKNAAARKWADDVSKGQEPK